MLRPIFVIGLFALAGLFLLKVFFGVFGGLLGLVLGLLGLALKIAIVGAIVYVVIRIVSPETARRLRERFSGPLS
jgi:hypothetical protein